MTFLLLRQFLIYCFKNNFLTWQWLFLRWSIDLINCGFIKVTLAVKSTEFSHCVWWEYMKLIREIFFKEQSRLFRILRMRQRLGNAKTALAFGEPTFRWVLCHKFLLSEDLAGISNVIYLYVLWKANPTLSRCTFTNNLLLIASQNHFLFNKPLQQCQKIIIGLSSS